METGFNKVQVIEIVQLRTPFTRERSQVQSLQRPPSPKSARCRHKQVAGRGLASSMEGNDWLRVMFGEASPPLSAPIDARWGVTRLAADETRIYGRRRSDVQFPCPSRTHADSRKRLMFWRTQIGLHTTVDRRLPGESLNACRFGYQGQESVRRRTLVTLPAIARIRAIDAAIDSKATAM